MPRSGRVAVFALLAAVFFVACANDAPDDVVLEGGDSELPSEVFEDFVTQETDSGLVKWRLTAPRARRFNKRGLLKLERPTIEFFDANGKPKTKLVSDAGEYIEEDRNMLAYGNVVIHTVEGDVLETDSLLFVRARNKIVSNSHVKLTRENDIVTGVGLECDPDLTSVNILSDVQARIIDDEGEISN